MGVALSLLMLASLGATPHRSAVIVGVNESFDESQPKLRYADDDAARYYELLRPMVDHVELLTVLDDESQGLYPDAAAVASAPDEATVVAALARARERGKAAKREGRRAEMYFVYVGHGRVHGGEGQVRLLAGTFGRPKLIEHVLSDKDHDRIHVIIDACNAYHLVNARGPAATAPLVDLDASFERFVADQSLARFPTVGVVLSTSGAGATHEWSRYSGGVFSHEIRSALAGAADADGDGRVDYVEVEAFTAAANLKVPALKGRPKIYVQAPAIERAASITPVQGILPRVDLPAPLAGHYYFEDERGLRYAELNKAAGFAVSLRLLPRRTYEMLRGDGARVGKVVPADGIATVTLPLTATPPAHWPRGDEAPANAFSEPFGPRFVDGFRASRRSVSSTLPAQRGTPALEILAYTAGAVGLAAAGGAIWQGTAARRDYDRYVATYDRPERDALEDDVRAERNRAVGLSVTAVVGVAVGTVLYFLAD